MTSGHVLREFIDLKLKMYNFIHEKKINQKEIESICMEENATANGVNRVVVQSSIQHGDYKSCLFNGEFQMDSMVTFRSFKHQICTVVQNKTSLSKFDDKRHILDDGIHPLSRGLCKTLMFVIDVHYFWSGICNVMQ